MTGFLPIGGMGMGGGFTLGGPNNLFGATAGDASDIPATVNPATNRAAAEGVRDAYFTANPGNLTQYNNDSSLNIRLFYTVGGDNVIVHQVRQGGAWVDNGSVMAIQGPAGMGTLPAGIQDGRAIVALSGAPVAGPLRSVGGNWEADQSLRFMGGNIDLTNFNIQSNGPMVTGRDTISDQVFLFPSRQLTTDASADLEIDRPSARTSATFQGRNDETLNTATEIAFNFNELVSAYIDQYTLASGGSGKFYVIVHRGTSASDPVEYQTHTQAQIDAEDVFDASNTTITLETNPLFLVQGHDYYFRIIKVGTPNLIMGGTTTTQADVDDPNNGFTVVGQEVPQFVTRFWPIAQEKVLTENDITNTGSGQVITTAERNKLNSITAFFRGNFSTTATYQHGDIVRSNYLGRPAMFVSATAQLPSTTLPEAGLDTGFWFLVTDRTWRGAWVASDYVPGQMVTNGGELWVALTTIGVGDTNPPSSTNTSWAQISGGGSGTGTSVEFRRQSTTLPQTTADNTIVIVDDTGSSAITITLPDADGTYIDNGITVVNARPSAAVTVTIQSGDTFVNEPSNQVVLQSRESIQAVTGEANNWVAFGGRTLSAASGGDGPYNGYTAHTGDVTLTSSQTGVNAYTGTADATFTLPSGLGASDTWLSFIDNRSTAGMLTVSGGVTPNVLESGQGSVVYWSGSQFVQGALKTRSNVASFPDHPNNPIQASTQYTYRGSTYTTGSNGITYGNSDARGVFLNTHLRMQTSTTYIHDLPELSLIEDSEGFTITKNSNSSDQLIRPFSGATITFGSTTFTFANPLRLTSGTATVVKSGSQSWLVTNLTGTFIGGTSSGGSGQSQSDQFSGQFFNETGSAVETGDGVHIKGDDGNQSFVETGPGPNTLLSGFAQEDIVANQSGQIARDGPINLPKIRITNGIQIGAPLTSGDPLYWYPGGTGPTPGYLTLDQDGGANHQAVTVITSDWLYSTQEYTANVIIDEQAEWDAAVDKVHVKNSQTSLDFQLPDLAEGSSEVTATAGQRLIVHIPLSGGTGTIRPRGASEIAPQSGSGTTYTNASPLPMTGGATAEYTLVVVNAAANGYEYYPLNTAGINTLGFFDRADYYYQRLSTDTATVNALANSNSARLDSFENELVIQAPGTYTASNDNILYTVAPTSNTSHTFTIGAPANWNLATNRSAKFRLKNFSNQFFFKLAKNAAFNEFAGTSVDELWVPPGATWDIVIWNDGSNYNIEKIGEIGYDFVFVNSLFTGTGNPTWTVPAGLPALPTQLVEVPTGNQERITVKYDGVIDKLRVDSQFSFTGTAAATFGALVSLTPSFTVFKNATSIKALPDSTVLNIASAKDHTDHPVNMFPISANEYINLTGTDFTDISASETTVRGRYVIKSE